MIGGQVLIESTIGRAAARVDDRRPVRHALEEVVGHPQDSLADAHSVLRVGRVWRPGADVAWGWTRASVCPRLQVESVTTRHTGGIKFHCFFSFATETRSYRWSSRPPVCCPSRGLWRSYGIRFALDCLLKHKMKAASEGKRLYWRLNRYNRQELESA